MDLLLLMVPWSHFSQKLDLQEWDFLNAIERLFIYEKYISFLYNVYSTFNDILF